MEGGIDVVFGEDEVQVAKELFVEGKLRGSVTEDEMGNGFIRMLTLGAGGRVGGGRLMELVGGGKPLMDEPEDEELLGWVQAVDGASVSCPVDSIDCVGCPGVVFLKKVLT